MSQMVHRIAAPSPPAALPSPLRPAPRDSAPEAEPSSGPSEISGASPSGSRVAASAAERGEVPTVPTLSTSMLWRSVRTAATSSCSSCTPWRPGPSPQQSGSDGGFGAKASCRIRLHFKAHWSSSSDDLVKFLSSTCSGGRGWKSRQSSMCFSTSLSASFASLPSRTVAPTHARNTSPKALGVPHLMSAGQSASRSTRCAKRRICEPSSLELCCNTLCKLSLTAVRA
mmetsp:Transcript_79799/g.185290  ORF Transcript_79799/g.185290 Transcript_79799/m.185290 type:complete len:227 (+) Transcript_79799:696-1376(+)